MGNVPMIGRFTVQGRLPGLNEIVAKARYNRFAGASQKKKETRRCAFSVMVGSVPTFTVPVRVKFRWIEPDNRRDPDNIRSGAKFILDALVELGRIPGDGRKWIKAIEDEFPPADAVAPRIEVELVAEGE